jgi:hypothetical protein
MAAKKKSVDGSVTFSTTLSAFGNNTGIEVPADVLEQLGGGKRPAVQVDVNGYRYQVTAGVMGGKTLLPVNAAIRKETGLAGGDPITVTLTLATAPKEAAVPDDFAAAMAAAKVRPFFDGLSNSLQRFHIDNVNGAKSADTRARRIEKSVALFREGKQR